MDTKKALAVIIENSKRRGFYFDFLALLKISTAGLCARIFSAFKGGEDAYGERLPVCGGGVLSLVPEKMRVQHKKRGDRENRKQNIFHDRFADGQGQLRAERGEEAFSAGQFSGI